MKILYRNRLPHLAPPGGTFFITFRLFDSLPRQVLKYLIEEYSREESEIRKGEPLDFKAKLNSLYLKKFESLEYHLEENPFGKCFLKDKRVANIVAQKIREYNHSLYDLKAYCIMPNHVHLLIDTSVQIINDLYTYQADVPENYLQLDKIMQLIKGGSAFLANQILNRKGSFWAKDSYDRYVRNYKAYQNIYQYIIQNPVKAGLVSDPKEYPFTYFGE